MSPSAPRENKNGSRIWRRLPSPVQRGLQSAPLIGPLLAARWRSAQLAAEVAALTGQVTELVAQRSAGEARLTAQLGNEMQHSRECLARIEALTTQQLIAQNMQVWRQIADHPDARAVAALPCFGAKGYSQNEEDGILLEIFRRVGSVHRTFIEVGTGNGLENNTTLWLKQGWRGAWFEGNPQHLKFIRENFAPELAAHRLHATEVLVTRENLSALVAAAGFAGEIDLLSIDVDGNDCYIFERLTGISPRVVVIEYNAKFPPPLRWVIPYDPGFCWDGSDWFGASLEAMNDVFVRKGYSLVGCNVTGANAFFVRNDLVGNHFHRPGDVAAHYQPARYFLTTGLFAHLGGHAASARGGLNPLPENPPVPPVRSASD